MTNKELYIKMKKELGSGYQIGLHNATKEAYIFKSQFDDSNCYVDLQNVTETDIVTSILNNGLYVPKKGYGLMSTVTFLDKLTPKSFDYSYHSWKKRSNNRYVVVVAIPNYICMNGKKYFIGNMIHYIDIANYTLFHTLLPKELIYGYYVKQVIDSFEDGDYLFKSELDFYPNDCFYGYMTENEQEQFWLKYFQNNKIDISILETVNYSNILNTLFKKNVKQLVRKKTNKI